MDPHKLNEQALHDLVAAYAAGVDARRYGAVGRLFTTEGVLVTLLDPHSPEANTTVGRQAIGRALQRLDHYESTRHLVLATTVELHDGGSSATGSSECEAHHFLRAADGSPTDRVLTIRYFDAFEHVDDTWRFARREVRVLRSEHHAANINL